MQITKRNGRVALFDMDKLAKSMLNANAQVHLEALPEKQAFFLAGIAFNRATTENEIVTTADVRAATAATLRENGYPATAEAYMAYIASKAK